MFNVTSFPRISAYVDTYNLAAATAETITRPAGYSVAVITADAACYVRNGGAAVATVADVVNGTGSILVPANVPRIIDFNLDAPTAPLASISIISTPGGNVSVEWFK